MARPRALWRNREPETEAGASQPRRQPLPGRPAAERSRQARPIEPIALDRLIHEQMRLGIVSALAVNESLSFNDLKKFFVGRFPKTEYRLTPAGRRALESYLDQMEALIRATRER